MDNNYITHLPDSICDLSKLALLSVHSNALESIPENIGNLQYLFFLRLSKNNISIIPNSIGNLSRLQFLVLADNRIKSIPFSLYNLISLWIFENQLTSIPDEIYKLSHLEVLDVSYNNISALPLTLRNISTLQDVRVQANHINGTLEMFSGMSNLYHLDVSCNNFDGPLPDSLSNKLAYFNASYNSLSKRIPTTLNWRSVSIFDISANSFIGDLHFLDYMKSLILLNISHNEFSGEIVPLLGAILETDTLLSVDISFNPIFDEFTFYSHLSQASSIQEFYLSNCPYLYVNLNCSYSIIFNTSFPPYRYGLPTATVKFPNLLILDASHSGTGISSFSNSPNIRMMDLSSSGISHFLDNNFAPLNNIEYLDLSNNNLLTDPYALLEPLDTLRTLRLSNNQFYGNLTFISSMLFLEYLDVSNNQFSGNLDSNVFSNLRHLNFVNLTGNHFNGSLPFFSPSDLTGFSISGNDFCGVVPESLEQHVAGIDSNPELWCLSDDGSRKRSMPRQLYYGSTTVQPTTATETSCELVADIDSVTIVELDDNTYKRLVMMISIYVNQAICEGLILSCTVANFYRPNGPNITTPLVDEFSHVLLRNTPGECPVLDKSIKSLDGSVESDKGNPTSNLSRLYCTLPRDTHKSSVHENNVDISIIDIDHRTLAVLHLENIPLCKGCRSERAYCPHYTGILNSGIDPTTCKCRCNTLFFDSPNCNNLSFRGITILLLITGIMSVLFVTLPLSCVLCIGIILQRIQKTRKQIKGLEQAIDEFKHEISIYVSGDQLKLLQVIGQGTYGKVYKALLNDTLIAVKSLKNFDSTNDRQYSSLLHEADLLRTLRHPNILFFFGLIETDEMEKYIAFEYAEYGDLFTFITTHEDLDLTHMITFLVGISKGMSYLHSKRIIHRLVVQNDY